MFKTHENSGFTLIELMVTVAILAITDRKSTRLNSSHCNRSIS
ncbi:MAG: type IV pilin protein, partial [Marinobacter sp.]